MLRSAAFWLSFVLIIALGAAGYEWHIGTSLKTSLAETQQNLSQTSYESSQLREKLDEAQTQISDLKTLLTARQAEKEAIGAQVQSLSSTVGVLDKLSKTDSQLLEKYSSVYFLNENYVPRHLAEIPASYRARPEKAEYFVGEAMPHLTDLMDAARASSTKINVLSAYRSFETQAELKGSYTVKYGAGTANSFSADQGYSEHQLGTTVDFTDATLGTALAGFDKTADYAWLNENAYRYGFILSYPKGNGHFVFEPWHWRYVGIELATRLHDEGKHFYDLDQREINGYLPKIFD